MHASAQSPGRRSRAGRIGGVVAGIVALAGAALAIACSPEETHDYLYASEDVAAPLPAALHVTVSLSASAVAEATDGLWVRVGDSYTTAAALGAAPDIVLDVADERAAIVQSGSDEVTLDLPLDGCPVERSCEIGMTIVLDGVEPSAGLSIQARLARDLDVGSFSSGAAIVILQD